MINQGMRMETGPPDAESEGAYRVVVAEADPTVLLLLRDQVAALGCVVVGAAYHWSAALDLAQSLHPDVLIIDLELQDADIDGLRVLTASQPALAVIGIAYAGYQDEAEAADAGMHHYLPRPFSLSKLAETLALTVARRRGHN